MKVDKQTVLRMEADAIISMLSFNLDGLNILLGKCLKLSTSADMDEETREILDEIVGVAGVDKAKAEEGLVKIRLAKHMIDVLDK